MANEAQQLRAQITLMQVHLQAVQIEKQRLMDQFRVMAEEIDRLRRELRAKERGAGSSRE